MKKMNYQAMTCGASCVFMTGDPREFALLNKVADAVKDFFVKSTKGPSEPKNHVGPRFVAPTPSH